MTTQNPTVIDINTLKKEQVNKFKRLKVKSIEICDKTNELPFPFLSTLQTRRQGAAPFECKDFMVSFAHLPKK